MNFRFFSGSSMPFNPSRNCCEASTTVRLIPKCSERSLCTCSHSLSLMTPSNRDCQLFLSSWGIARVFQQRRDFESGNPTSKYILLTRTAQNLDPIASFCPALAFCPGGNDDSSLGEHVSSCLKMDKEHRKYIP